MLLVSLKASVPGRYALLVFAALLHRRVHVAPSAVLLLFMLRLKVGRRDRDTSQCLNNQKEISTRIEMDCASLCYSEPINKGKKLFKVYSVCILFIIGRFLLPDWCLSADYYLILAYILMIELLSSF